MIAFVQGIVRLIRKESIVLDVQGVGYEVFVNRPLSVQLGQSLFLYTYQHIREDAMTLFGFIKEEDYEVFLRLINVKGIGPKTALNMLGVCSGKQMIQAIEQDDIKLLKSLPGIGAKTAGQIVLDLKGKFVSTQMEDSSITDPVWKETEEALLALGYKSSQLSAIAQELTGKELSVNEMLRQALASLAKRKGV